MCSFSERALWAFALLLVGVIAWHDAVTSRQVFYAEVRAARAAVRLHAETIEVLYGTLQAAKESVLASERSRRACEEGLGLARLRQDWVDRQLGLSQRLEEGQNNE